MWNVFQEKFISNDDEYCAVLVVLGFVKLEYATPKARELYYKLSEQDIIEIKRRVLNENVWILWQS